MLTRLLATGLALLFLLPSQAQWNFAAEDCENATRKYQPLPQDAKNITTNFQGQPLDPDNDNSGVLPIGFDFPFNGQTFTSFILNTNGFIKLGNIAPSSAMIAYTQAVGTGHSAITAPDSNLLYPFNRNMIAKKETSYRIHTTGKEGKRVCTIEFAELADNVTPAQFSSISFQLKLYETTGVIEFIYGEWKPTTETDALTVAAVGIKGNGTKSSVNVMKGSVVPWDIPMAVSSARPYLFIDGNYDVKGPNFGVRVTTLPDKGRTYRFIPVRKK
jgi:trimeric autotransporter adhesin